MNSTSPRILIVRLSAIGDIIHGIPILNAIRDTYPSAHIGWVVEGAGAMLLQGQPALNALLVTRKGWLKSLSEVMRIRREMRSHCFDIAIDLQGLTKSALAAWLSGAPVRIGLGGHDGKELSQWFYNKTVTPDAEHVIDRSLQLLTAIDIKEPSPRFSLPADEESDAKAAAVITDMQLESGFAVLNPGAGWPSKRWPPERFSEVALSLKLKHNLPSVVTWAGELEKSLAKQICDTAVDAAIMAPPTTLRELAALLNHARIFVGSDTGPLHLAVAAGTPCVGLYGPMPAERNGPYGTKHIALQQMRIDGTSRERRQASTEAMEAITVEQVNQACDRILEAGS